MASKVLTIDTALGAAKNKDMTDPLMLTEVTGQEGISIPYLYTVTMARNPDLGNVPPQEMIGTMARIGIKRKDSDEYVYRTGMIQSFQAVGKYTKAGGVGDTGLLVYKATMVPAFQLLAQETRYRVFTQLDVVSIINRIFTDMSGRSSSFKYDTDRLNSSDFDKLDYCVQFGESTFAFLMRLMSRFGIWYIFDHGKNAGNLPLLMQAENETMVLGKYPNVPEKACAIHTHKLTDDDPDQDTIANFQRQSMPQLYKIWAGNFNILDPTKPVTATGQIRQTFDVLKEQPALDGFAESEEFPGRFENDPSTTEAGSGSGQSDRSAKDYTASEELQEEMAVFSVSGGTKNATMLAGRKFDIAADPNDLSSDAGDYLLKMVFFNGYEHSYLTSTLTDLCNFIFRDFMFAPFQSGDTGLDFTVGVVNAGLNNYLQNSQSEMWRSALYKSDPAIYDKFLPYTLGGITQSGITSAISLLVSDIKKAVDANAGNFSTTFVAIPRNPPQDVFRVPTPTPGPRPVAHGPHSAMVIGPDGVDTKGHDIYADALGRVRIRFPWDPGPPKQQPGLPPPWTSGSPGKPYGTGDNTCWVRVSEEWAGRHYGSQFLPRIGQEVLVSFIDGDPEKPVITGRLYNADSTTTNIPFPDPQYETTQLGKLSDLPNTTAFNEPLSGIKTHSVPTTDSSGKALPTRYHLLRFSDKRDNEQYLIRSQHRLDITAFQTRYESIHLDRHLTVGGKKTDPKKIQGDYITKIFRHYYLHVGDPDFATESGNRVTLLEQNEELKIVKDSLLSIGGNWNTAVGGNYYLHVGGGPSGGGKRTTIIDQTDEIQVTQDLNQTINGNWSSKVAQQATVDANMTIVLNANTNISLVVGSSSIVITPSAIAITAPMVMINSSGPPPASPMDPPPVTTNDPSVPAPTEPTAADPGDKLTPPE